MVDFVQDLKLMGNNARDGKRLHTWPAVELVNLTLMWDLRVDNGFLGSLTERLYFAVGVVREGN